MGVRAEAGESLRLTSGVQSASGAPCSKIRRRRACLRPADHGEMRPAVAGLPARQSCNTPRWARTSNLRGSFTQSSPSLASLCLPALRPAVAGLPARQSCNTPRWARTSNLRFRRPMLYPIELGVRLSQPYRTGPRGPRQAEKIAIRCFRTAESPGCQPRRTRNPSLSTSNDSSMRTARGASPVAAVQGSVAPITSVPSASSATP